jgi:Na+/melibiose symporter-like transporter
MVPDVIDLSELVLGERKDGILYSAFIVCSRLGVAISLFMSNYALGEAGYESPAHGSVSTDSEASDLVVLTLRLLFAIVPAILLVTACIPMSFYNISRSRHVEIMHQVEIERDRKTTLLRQSKLPPPGPDEILVDEENIQVDELKQNEIKKSDVDTNSQSD